MADCAKCKHHPLYPTILLSDSVDDVYVSVKFREGIYLDTSQGLTRVLPGQKMQLSYTALNEILIAEGRAVFYFLGESEHSTFLLLYPEYTTWNL